MRHGKSGFLRATGPGRPSAADPGIKHIYRMALSLINTECRRYGCIKNLLACYANCRYNTRCDDLRNEIADKKDQAARDINEYLAEHGEGSITISFPKKGVRFLPASKNESRSLGRVRR